MIAEMIIGVAEHDVESHSAKEFSEILSYIGATVKNEIYDVQITIACATAGSVIKAKQRHGGSEMNATAILRSVKAFGEQQVAVFGNPDGACLCHMDACLGCEMMREVLNEFRVLQILF